MDESPIDTQGPLLAVSREVEAAISGSVVKATYSEEIDAPKGNCRCSWKNQVYTMVLLEGIPTGFIFNDQLIDEPILFYFFIDKTAAIIAHSCPEDAVDRIENKGVRTGNDSGERNF